MALRTGFDPPRIEVEENLHEIARRIRLKEAYYARLIQKRFRGMQARRFLRVFLKEVRGAWGRRGGRGRRSSLLYFFVSR